MELTPAELTILGLVIERPAHGYDLERVIDQRGIRQWTAVGFSSIYYLLTKLEKRGLIQSEHATPGSKSRRVFHATDEGKHVARQEVIAHLADAQPVPHPFLVGIANLPLLTDREYAEALRARFPQIEARIAAVNQAAESQAPLPLAAREVFSYSLSLLEAERSWLATRVQISND
ncbi:MAG: PadR family transcriptional regulator [Desertimonas sp.]